MFNTKNKAKFGKPNQPGRFISDDSFSLKFDLNMVSKTGDQMLSIARFEYSLRPSTISITSHMTVGFEKSIRSIFVLNIA